MQATELVRDEFFATGLDLAVGEMTLRVVAIASKQIRIAAQLLSFNILITSKLVRMGRKSRFCFFQKLTDFSTATASARLALSNSEIDSEDSFI
jgi:hypothetical protein